MDLNVNELLWCSTVLYGVYTLMYVTVGLPFLLVDLYEKPKWVLKYKIQNSQSQQIRIEKLPSLFKNHLQNAVFVQLPFGVLYAYMLKWRGCDLNLTVPNWTRLPAELMVCAVISEIIFYYTHRILHLPFLYKRVHKKHHEWTEPLGLTAFYAHPFEFVFSNMTTVLLPPLFAGCCLSNALIWMALGLATTIIHHSGYHLPFLPSPEFHDFHHLKFIGNYGVLGILDRLHGTDEVFRKSVAYQRHHLIYSEEGMLRKDHASDTSNKERQKLQE